MSFTTIILQAVEYRSAVSIEFVISISMSSQAKMMKNIVNRRSMSSVSLMRSANTTHQIRENKGAHIAFDHTNSDSVPPYRQFGGRRFN